MLFCHITSHVEGDPYPDLLQQKGNRAFPSLTFLDPAGEVIARQPSRARTVPAFEKTHRACANYLKLKRRVDEGDDSARPELLMAQIEMGGIDFETATKTRKTLGKLPTEQDEKLGKLLFELEISETAKRVRTRKQAIKTGKQFLEIWNSGRAPTGESASSFYALVMEYAYDQKDAKVYARAFKRFDETAPQGRNRKRVIQRMQRRLDELKQRRDG
ncbi:MAG: hypothetical protein NXI31_21945 [bacterium]|nr:hypothetical protein [bacterium]